MNCSRTVSIVAVLIGALAGCGGEAHEAKTQGAAGLGGHTGDGTSFHGLAAAGSASEARAGDTGADGSANARTSGGAPSQTEGGHLEPGTGGRSSQVEGGESGAPSGVAGTSVAEGGDIGIAGTDSAGTLAAGGDDPASSGSAAGAFATSGAANVSTTCGNAELDEGEVCDDGPTGKGRDGDGCSADCTAREVGWICRNLGTPCIPRCGDGMIVEGIEQCDDGNPRSGDGCSRTCLIEKGHTCTGEPSTCTTTECGDGVVEGAEICDNGAANGLFYGDGKGCSRACTPEPLCRDPFGGPTRECTAICGDGMRLYEEACDDGNRVGGDGCSPTCTIEPGNACEPIIDVHATPCSAGDGDCLRVAFIARDFKGQNEDDGHPDFFYLGATGINGQRTCCVPRAECDPDHSDCPDAASDITPWCTELVEPHLDDNGRPAANAAGGMMCECQFTDSDDTGIVDDCSGRVTINGHYGVKGPVQMIASAESFAQWYAADHPTDASVKGALELRRSGNVFTFSAANGRTVNDDIHDGVPLESGFFPVDGLASSSTLCNLWGYWLDWPGCVGNQRDLIGQVTVDATGAEHNFYYTTEARILFVHRGGERVSLAANDDAWVFINGNLAVDLGGTHLGREDSVTLRDGEDPRFGIEVGKAYELSIFHANRHPRDSKYELTLNGFKNERSVCGPACGDGIKTAMEECDDGEDNSDTAYGGCKTDCTFGPFCGDGSVNGLEICDDGMNTTLEYGAVLPACAPGCVPPPRCGDNVVDDVEECDDGDGNNIDGVSGGCSSECRRNG